MVILILVAVTLSALNGENGILANVKNLAVATDVANTVEKAKLEITALKSGRSDGQITDEEASTIIASYDKDGTIKVDEDGNKYILTSKNNKVLVSSIWGGTVTGAVYEVITGKNESGDQTWTRNGVTVTIGDYVAYDHVTGVSEGTTSSTKDGNGDGTYEYDVSKYSGGWRVLGVDSNGALRLISAEPVTETSGNKQYFRGITGYQNAVSELNKISAIYGHGKYAKSAQSVTVEDINDVTGYNASTAKYNDGQLNEYGNEVTYSWDKSNLSYPAYSSKNKTGNLSDSHYRFCWFEDGEWNNKAKPTSLTENEEITTLTSTYYYYYPCSLSTNSSTSATDGILYSGKAYDLLFTNTSSRDYWLASPCVNVGTRYVDFVLRIVKSECVTASTYLVDSSGFGNGYNCGVRSLVTLESDVWTDSGENKDKTGTSITTAWELK